MPSKAWGAAFAKPKSPGMSASGITSKTTGLRQARFEPLPRLALGEHAARQPAPGAAEVDMAKAPVGNVIRDSPKALSAWRYLDRALPCWAFCCARPQPVRC